MGKELNILLSFDDNDWNYTRHAAVTLLSLLETNKNNKIKIRILSWNLSQENINELKRIVWLYNQEINFIIRDDIIPEKLKKVIVNHRQLTRWARYRLFFPKYIKWIDRILYLDCDILVMKDISEIYNMDMKWKAIAGYLDIIILHYKNKAFWLKNYINSWVLLFDVKNYDMGKINADRMKEINEKYWKYFDWCDQDKINLIFKDDIIVGKEWMNYQIRNEYFTAWVDKAEIIHCLQKPYVKNSSLPKKFIKLYNHYLSLTKWKWYPKKEAEVSYLRRYYYSLYSIWVRLWILIFWKNFMKKLNIFTFLCREKFKNIFSTRK